MHPFSLQCYQTLKSPRIKLNTFSEAMAQKKVGAADVLAKMGTQIQIF